jgi:hypothetical protein
MAKFLKQITEPKHILPNQSDLMLNALPSEYFGKTRTISLLSLSSLAATCNLAALWQYKDFDKQ